MTDRELLELAARSGGNREGEDVSDQYFSIRNQDECEEEIGYLRAEIERLRAQVEPLKALLRDIKNEQFEDVALFQEEYILLKRINAALGDEPADDSTSKQP